MHLYTVSDIAKTSALPEYYFNTFKTKSVNCNLHKLSFQDLPAATARCKFTSI